MGGSLGRRADIGFTFPRGQTKRVTGCFVLPPPQPNPVPSGAGRSRSGVVGLATLDAYRLSGFNAREDCKLGKFFMGTETCTAHA